MVVSTIPYQVAAIAFLIASSLGLYRYFDNGETLSLPGNRTASDGSQVLLCILGLLAAASMLRVVYNKLRRFSFQGKLPKELGSIDLTYEGRSDGAMLRRLGETPNGGSQIHSLNLLATVSSFVHSLSAHFIAVERLNDRGTNSGVVWTSHQLGLLSRLAVIDRTDQTDRLVNVGKQIHRLTLQDGMQLRLEVESTDPRFFEPNSRFQVVVYLTHGGFLLKELAIPEPQATTS